MAAGSPQDIRIKRAYLAPADDDGRRILVDRLWPRGLARAKAAIDLWLKDVAPSTELRHWFGHDPARWAEFRKRYAAELAGNPAVAELREIAGGHDPARWAEFRKRYAAELAGNPAVAELREIAGRERVTLVYAAHDEAHNNAVALAAYLAGA
ncbi:DUF488 domain-containing protein [Edaphosphingomonas haloaromaticamans]|uniref:Uroporphyrin-III C-methyltransferase n=1 Tax=Edaphosphingomonas haloaromaticamans TaxID=653954 RepID=A0A1S1H9R2_9SPHN|nr:DUF488 family protein [Sphingomonas haloaromaticamans]OHT18815.1 hypothetical protein BHE75_00793 [Sphingomonas haloaromaticamans]